MLLFNWRVYQSGGALTVVGENIVGETKTVRHVAQITAESVLRYRRTWWGGTRLEEHHVIRARLRSNFVVAELSA